MARYEIRDKLIQSYRLSRQTMVPKLSKKQISTRDYRKINIGLATDYKRKGQQRKGQTKSPLEKTNSINPHTEANMTMRTPPTTTICNTGYSKLETSTYTITLSPHNHGLATGLSLDLSIPSQINLWDKQHAGQIIVLVKPSKRKAKKKLCNPP